MVERIFKSPNIINRATQSSLWTVTLQQVNQLPAVKFFFSIHNTTSKGPYIHKHTDTWLSQGAWWSAYRFINFCWSSIAKDQCLDFRKCLIWIKDICSAFYGQKKTVKLHSVRALLLFTSIIRTRPHFLIGLSKHFLSPPTSSGASYLTLGKV